MISSAIGRELRGCPGTGQLGVLGEVVDAAMLARPCPSTKSGMKMQLKGMIVPQK